MRSLTLLLLSALLGGGVTPPRASGDVPRITNEGAEIVLPDPMRQALQMAFPGFQHWPLPTYEPVLMRLYKITPHQTPFAVIGDFNGDGIQDIVLAGYTAENR
jgi:hypothetical protein